MGYDSRIDIVFSEIPYVESLLQKNGFKKIVDRVDRYQLATYRKYIDDQCKFKEGTLFCIYKSKNTYSVCGRNWASCSSFDLKLHNDTLSYLSSQLKRDFYTDEGTNLLFETGPLTYGVENALGFPFGFIHNQIEDILYFLSRISPLSESQIALNKVFGGNTFFNQESFSVNLLSIYTISILETYFKTTFINILKCLTPSVVSKIESKTNIPKYAQEQYSRGLIDNEQKIAEGYSFQNIKSIIKTYKNRFGVDLTPVFIKKTYLKKSVLEIVDEMFSIRHNNVHHLHYAYLTEDAFIKRLTIIVKTLNETYRFLCKHYSVKRIESDLIQTSVKQNIDMVKHNRKMHFS